MTAMTKMPAMPSIFSLMTASRGLALSGITGAFRSQKRREALAKTYSELLEADDHILRDIGVTRLDVMRMREDLFRK